MDLVVGAKTASPRVPQVPTPWSLWQSQDHQVCPGGWKWQQDSGVVGVREQRTYSVRLGSKRVAPIAGEVSWGRLPSCSQSQEQMWAVPRGRVPEKPRSLRATGFQWRRGERGEEERGAEGEGEEGIIGRLRCEESTFPASETAKQPLAGRCQPLAGLPKRRGWSCWGLLDQETGSCVVPDPQGPQRQGPSSSLLLLAHLPKGEPQVSISPGLGSLILALRVEITRSSLKRRNLPPGGRRWAWLGASTASVTPCSPYLLSGHREGGVKALPPD